MLLMYLDYFNNYGRDNENKDDVNIDGDNRREERPSRGADELQPETQLEFVISITMIARVNVHYQLTVSRSSDSYWQ